MKPHRVPWLDGNALASNQHARTTVADAGSGCARRASVRGDLSRRRTSRSAVDRVVRDSVEPLRERIAAGTRISGIVVAPTHIRTLTT